MCRWVIVPPPVYALALLAACQGLSMLLPLTFDMSQHWLGLVLLAAGLVLDFWAISFFFRSRTTPLPMGKPIALVAEGPYRWSRNPMYLGLLLVLLAFPFLLGSPWFLLASPGFFAVVDRLFVPYEEERLSQLFGSRYREQMDRVRRWL